VLYNHVTPVIGNGVVVDMPTLFNEIDVLEGRGVSCSRLKVSSLAQLIFPWHQAFDAVAENARGDAKIGTTLKGIGPAYADKALRVGIRAGDVRDMNRFEPLVRERAITALAMLKSVGGESFDVEEVVARFVVLGKRLAPYIANTVDILHDAIEANKSVLLEGAQATFLDIDHGTYPFVTSSNPTAGGACAGTGIGPRYITRVVGIAKAYTTRVGAGPYPTELHGVLGDAIVDIGHEFGTVTGRRRRPGWLDLVMLRHAVRLNSLTEIALTKLDVLDTFDTIQLGVGYTLDGKRIAGYPDDIELLGRVEAEYVELAGWKTNLRECRTFESMPLAARTFVETVERYVGVPVKMIGVGPERDDCVIR
jgi:adenylosuccinate synthase